jgi:mono/diheme cytochrome c family protein
MKRMGLFVLTCAVLLSGCRGDRSAKPPIHFNPNMDWQAKYKAQVMPLDLPEGVVAWGENKSFSNPASRDTYLKADSVFYFGKTESGQFVSRIPVKVTEAMLKRGQERFNIYCAVCHDQAGEGRGLVVQRGYPLPPSLADERLLSVEDGYIFDVITNGIRNMPAYRKQIVEADRWAIVAYVRALQKMNTATINDVPESQRGELR